MATIAVKLIDKHVKELNTITSASTNFLKSKSTCSTKLRKFNKEIYDTLSGTDGVRKPPGALETLIIKNFDDEQVWGELELQNDPSIADLVSGRSLCSLPENLKQTIDTGGCIRTKSKSSNTKLNREVEETSGTESEDEHSDANEISTDKRTQLRSSRNVQLSSEEDENFGDEDEGEFHDGKEDLSDAEEDEEEEEDEVLNRIKERLAKTEEETAFSDENDDLNFDFDPMEMGEDDDDDDDGEEEDGDDDDGDEEEEENEKEESDQDDFQDRPLRKAKGSKPKHSSRSEVDDKFFKLSEMEAFLEQEDARELKKQKQPEEEEEEDDIDMFADIPSSDEEGHSGGQLMYQDFFDPPEGENVLTDKKGAQVFRFGEDMLSDSENEENESKQKKKGKDKRKKKVRFQTEPEGEESSASSEGEDVTDILGGKKSVSISDKKESLSSHELRQERLKRKIAELEDASLAEKSWQLSGEIVANSRPENSLLEEQLDYESTTRRGSEITPGATQKLEDLIKQRIKDQAWDDVEKKTKPKEEAFQYRRHIELQMEKSKKSLSEVYEEVYLHQQETEHEEKEDPRHQEINKMMTSLFVKLDALSNFHFTPRPRAPDIKVVSNLPAITVEEVAPVAVSDAQMLAPEEVQSKLKGQLKGKTERTTEDRKRERRMKKAHMKMKSKKKQLDEKKKEVTKNKDSKENVKLKSANFFSELQTEVTNQLKNKVERKKKKKEKAAEKLKL